MSSEEIYKNRLRDQTTEYLTDLMYRYLDSVRLIREVLQEREKMQMCNNLCLRIKAAEQVSEYAYNGRKRGMYANGYKRCTKCQINLKIPEFKCPCCHSKMRATNCRSAKRAITEKARY